MADEEMNDAIIEDLDDQVDDDEMSPTEAAFQKGADEAAEGDGDKEDKEGKDDDEVE